MVTDYSLTPLVDRDGIFASNTLGCYEPKRFSRKEKMEQQILGRSGGPAVAEQARLSRTRQSAGCDELIWLGLTEESRVSRTITLEECHHLSHHPLVVPVKSRHFVAA